MIKDKIVHAVAARGYIDVRTCRVDVHHVVDDTVLLALRVWVFLAVVGIVCIHIDVTCLLVRGQVLLGSTLVRYRRPTLRFILAGESHTVAIDDEAFYLLWKHGQSLIFGPSCID